MPCAKTRPGWEFHCSDLCNFRKRTTKETSTYEFCRNLWSTALGLSTEQDRDPAVEHRQVICSAGKRQVSGSGPNTGEELDWLSCEPWYAVPVMSLLWSRFVHRQAEGSPSGRQCLSRPHSGLSPGSGQGGVPRCTSELALRAPYEIVRGHGARRARFRGTRNNQLQALFGICDQPQAVGLLPFFYRMDKLPRVLPPCRLLASVI